MTVVYLVYCGYRHLGRNAAYGSYSLRVSFENIQTHKSWEKLSIEAAFGGRPVHWLCCRGGMLYGYAASSAASSAVYALDEVMERC